MTLIFKIAGTGFKFFFCDTRDHIKPIWGDKSLSYFFSKILKYPLVVVSSQRAFYLQPTVNYRKRSSVANECYLHMNDYNSWCTWVISEVIIQVIEHWKIFIGVFCEVDITFCEIWVAFINNCVIIHLVFDHFCRVDIVVCATAYTNITAISSPLSNFYRQYFGVK